MEIRQTTSKRTIWKYPKVPISTTVLGDSQTKYLFQYFDPLLQGTPAFVTQPGAFISDVESLLDLVPSSTRTLVLHVGSNDLTRKSGLATFRCYRHLLDVIHEERPEISHVYATLVLPRATNRRRRNNNTVFVHCFNREASHFNSLLRSFCKGFSHLSILDHMFEWLPPGRVLAADGLHVSFEGVALMSSHIRQLCFDSPGEASSTSWSDCVSSPECVHGQTTRISHQTTSKAVNTRKTQRDTRQSKNNNLSTNTRSSGIKPSMAESRTSTMLADLKSTTSTKQQASGRACASRNKKDHSSAAQKNTAPAESTLQAPGKAATPSTGFRYPLRKQYSDVLKRKPNN